MTESTIRAAKAMVFAVAEAIRDLGEVPSGHVYAAVMGHMTLEQYEAIVGLLVETKMVKREPGHLLRWIGPAKAGR